MAAQYLLPGVGDIHDAAGSNEYLLPGLGDFSEGAGGNPSPAITGVSATAAVGSMGLAISTNPGITGVSATAAVGSMGLAISTNPAITGVSATAAVGVMTVSVTGGTTSVNLTGVSVTAAVGVMTVSGTTPLPAVVTIPAAPPVPTHLVDEREHRRLIAVKINEMSNGQLNAVGRITLEPTQTSTTLIDAGISAFSHIEFMPESASAATAKGSIWINSRRKGFALINHASNAATDQSFTYLIIG
jgi:hypothetical protein